MFSDVRVRGRGVRYIQTSPLSTSGPCRALAKCENSVVVQTYSRGANEDRTSRVFRLGRRCHGLAGRRVASRYEDPIDRL